MKTDHDLVMEFRAGSQTAFLELYESHKLRVFRYCYRLLYDRTQAEDATQETFLKALTNLDRLEEATAFRSWLLKIARNEVFGILRRAKWNGEENPVEPQTEETPLKTLVELETKDAVHSLLSILKPEYRDVLILREFEQLTYEEIAAITGDTESSVKSRLFKARKALAKKFQEKYSKEDL